MDTRISIGCWECDAVRQSERIKCLQRTEKNKAEITRFKGACLTRSFSNTYKNSQKFTKSFRWTSCIQGVYYFYLARIIWNTYILKQFPFCKMEAAPLRIV